MIEHITKNNQIHAIIVSCDFSNKGITFFTPNNFSQQLAYMNHPKGKTIQPHVHNPIKREILYTREVLFIKKGKIRVDFYTDDQEYICSRILESGDVLMLATGGHGFEMLEDTEMFEVKQGPYTGEEDKTRFDGIINKNYKDMQ
jgi:mannose-6-phosphate isomerase-like protein (cupin superfamily)